MKRYRVLAAVGLALLGAASCAAPPRVPSTDAETDGFRPLFNGRDLTGWIDVNGRPDTWRVSDGVLVTTGLPHGFMRTDRVYENFILELEWMHASRDDDQEGNAGLFVWADSIPAQESGTFPRAVEIQILVNLEWRDEETGAVTASSHGDIFSIWGARCVPDRPHPLGWERSIPREFRANGFDEWNHYRVTARDGAITLEVNGKEVSAVSGCTPRKGYLALEAEGNTVYFRNLRILELPAGVPNP